MIVSMTELKNENLDMDEVDFILDDGFLADNTAEFHRMTDIEMNGIILKYIKETDCTVTSTANTISIEVT